MGLLVILLVIVVVAVAGVLIALTMSSWGGERQLPSPPPPPVEIPPVWQPQLPRPTQPRLQPETQRRIKRRARPVEPPAPPVGEQKKIRLHRRIKKREGTLSSNARCRVTRRPVLECSCENENCRKLRAKYGV